MQKGHLIEVGVLKNSALLTNLICGRGFGSVFHHQDSKKANRFRVAFFVYHRAGSGASELLPLKSRERNTPSGFRNGLSPVLS